jgi:hypothetical protein
MIATTQKAMQRESGDPYWDLLTDRRCRFRAATREATTTGAAHPYRAARPWGLSQCFRPTTYQWEYPR